MEALVEHVELLRERWLALRGTPVGAGAALAAPVLQVEVDGERDGFDGHLQVRRRDARVGHHQSARRRAPPQQTSHCRRKARVCPSSIRVICTYTVQYSCERAVVVWLTYRAYSDLSACQCVRSGEQVFFDRIFKQNFLLEKQYGDRRQIQYHMYVSGIALRRISFWALSKKSVSRRALSAGSFSLSSGLRSLMCCTTTKPPVEESAGELRESGMA